LFPGAPLQSLLQGLGVGGKIEFREMNPDGFDHLIIGGERFDQPKGRTRWIERLKARFPMQTDNLDRFFGLMGRLVADVKRSADLLKFPAVLAVPFRAPTLARWGFSTLGALLDKTISDPLLKGVLSAQCG